MKAYPRNSGDDYRREYGDVTHLLNSSITRHQNGAAPIIFLNLRLLSCRVWHEKVSFSTKESNDTSGDFVISLDRTDVDIR